MAQTAPFSSAMRLGQGFNTYTQELRLEGAVTITTPPSSASHGNGSFTPAAAYPNSNFPVNAPIGRSDGSSTRVDEEEASRTSSKKINGKMPTVQTRSPTTFTDAPMIREFGTALDGQVSSNMKGQLFTLPPGPVINANQSVTFSTRAINNMSDIMEALNISASMSIKYGTIHGNASAAYVNEDKVLDAQLNYLVSVRVNNNNAADPEKMIFEGIDSLPPDKFTEVYGDCFIAGFIEGGDFNAIISVDCHDKSKLTRLKEEIDMQLAVPPVPGLNVGASQVFDKGHTELFQGTEITISVNWTGGGELKPPDVPWTLQTVMAAANAFPNMVARCSARISAILKPYNALRTFIAWKYDRFKDYKNVADAFVKPEGMTEEKFKELRKRKNDEAALWVDKALVLNYAPCTIYTNDLFDAYMAYKKLWKRISYIMSDTTKWRMKTIDDVKKDLGHHADENGDTGNMIFDSPRTALDYQSPALPVPHRHDSKRYAVPEITRKENSTTTHTREQTDSNRGDSRPTDPPSSRCTNDSLTRDFATPTKMRALTHFDTFPVNNPNIKAEWSLDALNANRTPIPLDPVELNEARLLCREALTLITEEAASLTTNPALAYAEYNEKTKQTKMKRPNYVYPEVLKARLPIYIRNDAAADSTFRDAAMIKLRSFVVDENLYAHVVGDAPSQLRTYKPFVSLEHNENNDFENPLVAISLHAYAHTARYYFSKFSADSHMAIGGIGFCFANDKNPERDGCTQWVGQYSHEDDDPQYVKTLNLRNRAKDLKLQPTKSLSRRSQHSSSMFDEFQQHGARTLHFDSRPVSRPAFAERAVEDRDITKIEVYFVPGSGRISGLIFHDNNGPTELVWKQWDQARSMPSNMHMEVQEPTRDGSKWKFVGLMGDFDHALLGGSVLARISGVWRKT